jgi:hypothetical protein
LLRQPSQTAGQRPRFSVEGDFVEEHEPAQLDAVRRDSSEDIRQNPVITWVGEDGHAAKVTVVEQPKTEASRDVATGVVMGLDEILGDGVGDWRDVVALGAKNVWGATKDASFLPPAHIEKVHVRGVSSVVFGIRLVSGGKNRYPM